MRQTRTSGREWRENKTKQEIKVNYRVLHMAVRTEGGDDLKGGNKGHVSE